MLYTNVFGKLAVAPPCCVTIWSPPVCLFACLDPRWSVVLAVSPVGYFRFRRAVMWQMKNNLWLYPEGHQKLNFCINRSSARNYSAMGCLSQNMWALYVSFAKRLCSEGGVNISQSRPHIVVNAFLSTLLNFPVYEALCISIPSVEFVALLSSSILLKYAQTSISIIKSI